MIGFQYVDSAFGSRCHYIVFKVTEPRFAPYLQVYDTY